MYILHLIVEDCCKHTLFVESNKEYLNVPTAMSKLAKEANGKAAELIVCNGDNMPLSYKTIEADPETIKEKPWIWMAVGLALAITLLPSSWYIIS